jgi:hypothetical protein
MNPENTPKNPGSSEQDLSLSPFTQGGTHDSRENAAFFAWCQKQHLGASVAFKQQLSSEVDAWIEESSPALVGASNGFIERGAGTSSKSRSFLRHALAAYMGIAAALEAYVLLRSPDESEGARRPQQAAVGSQIEKR